MGYNDNYIKIPIVKTANDCIAFYMIGERMVKYSLTFLISGYKQVYTQYMEGYTDIIWIYHSISS